MTPTIRSVRRAELPQVYDLLEAAFPEARRATFVAQTEADSTFRLRHGRLAVADGRIVGYVRIFARTMMVRGQPVPVGGIGSVATHPDARGSGIATALLHDAIARMRRGGMQASFLYPGIPGFYERLGFHIVREPQFEAGASEVAALPDAGLWDLRPLRDADVPRMLAMMISMPLLVAECIGFGLVAAYFVSVNLLDIDGTYYVANMVRWTLMRDIIMPST